MPTTNPPTAAWDEKLLANPHVVADKRTRVQKMFAAIAPSYDLNNRLHSFWRDQAWRRKAVELSQLTKDDYVVDVACGTGDLSLAYANALAELRYRQSDIRPDAGQVLGLDFTYDMLAHAHQKNQILTPRGRNGFLLISEEERKSRPVVLGSTGEPLDTSGRHANVTQWINGDAQSLPLPDACADVVSIAFGIRNVQSIPTALKEFRRILKPGGRVIILEFSKPTNPLIRVLNDFYCGKVMPITATLISGDKSGAYKYLPKSVDTFISRENMMKMMADAGFASVQQFPMTFGVCVCYRGVAA
jgi:demethylmenaquinone methyltransferase/2-methoxy-6-polyprenyl-1,4-benzoquinol methylase